MLHAFLQRGAQQTFDWGARNCGLWVCDWIASVRGADPAAELRGRFKTATGLGRHIARCGGIEAFARDIATRAGLGETEAPGLGDVALLNVAEISPALAIADGKGTWIAKAMSGIVSASYPVIVAWKV